MAQHLVKQNRGINLRKSKQLAMPKLGDHWFIQILTGRAPLKIQKIAIWAVFLELVIVSAIAQILFPGGFSIFRETISHEGSFTYNPIGSIIWRIGVIINGFCHIPHILYIRRWLEKINLQKAKRFQHFGIISALGFVSVGIISMDYGTIHYIVALIAFIGYFFTANIAYRILKKGSYIGKSRLIRSNVYRFFKIYFNISGVATLASFIINKVFFQKDITPIIEWNYLLAICVWLIAWPVIFKTINKAKYLRMLKQDITYPSLYLQ